MSRKNDDLIVEIVNDRTKNKDTRDSPTPNKAGSKVREPRSRGKIAAVTAAQDKAADKVRSERKEASRLVSLANKRLRRLEQKGMTDNPAYVKSGGYFSIAGKNQRETQAELRRLDKFINAVTSTVRGTNSYLKDMAQNTGVQYKNLTDLRAKSKQFFELASKTEQYLRTVEDMASAIDYNQIWQQINVYVKENKVDLSLAQGDIDGMIKHVSQALKKFEDTTTVNSVTFRLKK